MILTMDKAGSFCFVLFAVSVNLLEKRICFPAYGRCKTVPVRL